MYPYQRNQLPYAPLFYPAAPSQMTVDPGRFPSSYDPCGWGGSYGYGPYPVHCHGCCNHNFFPGQYGVRPPYHHVPPPSYYHGYPAAEYIPPPHYTMQMPHYEYDKDAAKGHHCCGCANHPCNQKERNNVKIEEEDPVVEKQVNQPLVPLQAKNYPHPVVWLPAGYMKLKDTRKSDDSGYKMMMEGDSRSGNEKSSVQQPHFWNGWFPFDTSNMGSVQQEEDHKRKEYHEDDDKPQRPKLRLSEQGEDQKRTLHQQDDKQSNSPIPIFWMPYSPEITKRDQPKEETLVEQGPSSLIDFAPVKLNEAADKGEGNGEFESPKLVDKNSAQKSVPLKKSERRDENDKSLNPTEKKPAEDGGKRKSSSPQKTSKLPPVCLRVDPLPKRKGTNGNSRSPSPPGDKRKSDDASTKQCDPMSSNLNKNAKEDQRAAGSKSERSRETEQNRGKVKSIKVVDAPLMQEGNAKLNGSCQIREEIDVSKAKEEATSEAKESRKRKLTDSEAASVIQAAFRGFEVRKWEPLRKLKQLAKVKEQVAEIRSRIQALEASELSSDDKQKSIIAEMIMNLLLKLDTIQGLHPSIREIRKSVVKELVSLQETLDALIANKTEVPVEQGSAASSQVQNFTEAAANSVGGNGNEQDKVETTNTISNIDHDIESQAAEPCENLQIPETQDVKGADNQDNSMSSYKEMLDPPMDSVIAGNGKENDGYSVAGEGGEPHDREGLELMQLSEPQRDCGETIKHEDVTSLEDKDMRVMEEFPGKVIDERSDSKDFGDHLCTEIRDIEGAQTEESRDSMTELADGEVDNSHQQLMTQKEGEKNEIDGEVSTGIVEIPIQPEIEEDGIDAFTESPTEPEKAVAICDVLTDSGEELQQVHEVEIPNTELLVNDQVQDQGQEDHETTNSNSLPGSEDGLSTACLAAAESSNEQNVGDAETCLDEELDVHDAVSDASGKGSVAHSGAALIDRDSESDLSQVEAYVNPDEVGNIGSITYDSNSASVPAINEYEELNGTKSIGKAGDEQVDEGGVSPPSPTGSQVSLRTENDQKLIEENEKLREMMEKLMEAGSKQLTAISNLSGRVKYLEKRLSRKKKLKVRRHRAPASGTSCLKPTNDISEDRAVGLAM